MDYNQYKQRFLSDTVEKIYKGLTWTGMIGNSWIDSNWNIFASVIEINICGRVVARNYDISLEYYDKDDEYFDSEVDFIKTSSDSYKELYQAISFLLKKNKDKIWV